MRFGSTWGERVGVRGLVWFPLFILVLVTFSCMVQFSLEVFACLSVWLGPFGCPWIRTCSNLFSESCLFVSVPIWSPLLNHWTKESNLFRDSVFGIRYSESDSSPESRWSSDPGWSFHLAPDYTAGHLCKYSKFSCDFCTPFKCDPLVMISDILLNLKSEV